MRKAYMPPLLFRLWATVVTVLITPIVITAGSFFAREYGPFVAVILSLIALAYIAAMTYISFCAIGKMFGHQ
jgi:hypothetical protein